MKKLFTTILMLCVALVGWSAPPTKPTGGLSIPEGGWNATQGELTVNFTNGGCGYEEWKNLLENQGINISQTPVKKLILTGNFNNNQVKDITGEQAGHQLIDLFTSGQLDLDLTACTNVTSNMTTTTTTLTCETTTTYKLEGNNVTFKDNNGNVVTDPVPGTTYYGNINNQNVTFVCENGTWHAVFSQYYQPALTESTTKTFKDAQGNVVNTSNGSLKPNADGTWTLIVRNKQGGTLEFGNNKTRLSAIRFPANENFKYIPKELCNGLTNLTEITLPDNILIVEYKAFNNCTSLGDFDLPAYIEEIGIDAFYKCNLTTVDLRGLNSLWKIDAAAFDNNYNLANIYLPEEDNTTLTFFGNYVFGSSAATNLDFSHCLGIKHFAYDGADYFGESTHTTQGGNSSTKTFYWYTNLQTITLPPNLELLGEGCFTQCPALTKVTFTGTAKVVDGKLTNGLVIGKEAFLDDANLTTIKFAQNSNLYKITSGAFQRTGLTAADLSMCHELRLIETKAFDNCTNLASVKVCSHPKVLVNQSFDNCSAIRRVEVTACDDITDITQCVCQCGAFHQDITYCGTNADFNQVEANAAILVFPETAPVPQSSSYTSSFDFFVGDYKTGTLITQTGLNGLHKGVPGSVGPHEYKVFDYDANGNKVGEHMEYYSVPYQVGDGWHEFIKTEFGTIVKKEEGNFLRTYSRSIGSGPCILPNTIRAYRAVDYSTDTREWVKDKNGKYYCADENANPKEYILIPTTDGAFDSATLQLIMENGYNRYSSVTVGGKVYLKKLIPYEANLKDNQGKDIPYNNDVYYEDVNKPAAKQKTNKQHYDEIVFSANNNLTAVDGGVSYVPENTGVVLYSNNVNEDFLLVLGGHFGTEKVLPEYPHTGHRYEADRLISADTRNNINMLKGTYDVKTYVSPVFPWYGQNEDGTGGSYNDNIKPREYRNFTFKKSEMKWLRLIPCIAKDNRAFASIPIERFDNFNESHDQMPAFVEQDLNGADANSSVNLMLINIFEDEEGSAADGIKVVNTVIVNADNNAWYTIQGVRVAQPTKGVYIHNGKKVVIK